VSLEALRERLGRQAAQVRRFRQKVVHDAMGALWVDDEDFDIARHVVPTALDHREGQTPQQALQALCGELAMTPLDPARPLWQFHLIEHYDGGSALIARVHHCIGDGIALISVMMSMTDGGSDPPTRRAAKRPRCANTAAATAKAATTGWRDAVLEPVTDLTVKAIGMYGAG
jgi:diacylglycerol O-acyltransferase